MGEVIKPELPAGTPKDVAEFVECTGVRLSLGTGKAGWLKNLFKQQAAEWGFDADKLPEPSTTFGPGSKPGRVKATVSVDLGITVSLSVEVWIENGRLKIDASSLPIGRKGAEDWVEQLNDWVKSNGKAFGNILVAGGTATATKVTTAPAAQAPTPKGDAPKAAPAPTPDPKKTPDVKLAPTPAVEDRSFHPLWLVPVAFVLVVSLIGGALAHRNATSSNGPAASEVVAVADPTPPVAPVPPAPVEQPKTGAKSDAPKPDAKPAESAASDPLIYAYCQGVKHDGPGDSKELVAISSNVSGTAKVDVKGPKGQLSIDVKVENGRGEGSAPIASYGTYAIAKVTAPDGTVIEASKIPNYQPQTVGKTEMPCSASSLPAM